MTVLAAELFVVSASVVPAATAAVAVFVSEPVAVAGTVAVTVYVTPDPGGRVSVSLRFPVPLAEWVATRVIAGGSWTSKEDVHRSLSSPWPVAAWGDATGTYQVDVSMWPQRKKLKRHVRAHCGFSSFGAGQNNSVPAILRSEMSGGDPQFPDGAWRKN